MRCRAREFVTYSSPPVVHLTEDGGENCRRKNGRLKKFNITATQAISYFNSIAPSESFEAHYRLRAKYPIHAQGFASRVYECYDPNVLATARPVQFEVGGR
ncbi:MAG: hypothetical protein WBW85_07175 [Terriglobales bacterium]